uniref:Uncharacterized protein n=1 Tax=Anguilla anguilla TaxID=7936 RepID=A0A0E9TV31_ANGAN
MGNEACICARSSVHLFLFSSNA